MPTVHLCGTFVCDLSLGCKYTAEQFVQSESKCESTTESATHKKPLAACNVATAALSLSLLTMCTLNTERIFCNGSVWLFGVWRRVTVEISNNNKNIGEQMIISISSWDAFVDTQNIRFFFLLFLLMFICSLYFHLIQLQRHRKRHVSFFLPFGCQAQEFLGAAVAQIFSLKSLRACKILSIATFGLLIYIVTCFGRDFVIVLSECVCVCVWHCTKSTTLSNEWERKPSRWCALCSLLLGLIERRERVGLKPVQWPCTAYGI